MANFFKSDDVKVYPCSFRGYKTDNTTYNQKARLITEEGFVRPVAVGQINSYVISDVVNADNDEWLKVVIGGYYFEIKHAAYTFTHLYIRTRSIPTIGEEQTILAPIEGDGDTLDSNGIFKGIAYASSDLGLENYIYLHVFNDAATKIIYSNAHLPSYDVENGTISLNGNTVKNKRSAAFGTETSARSIDNEFVVGKYNDDEEALFIVGNGDKNKKSNAFSTGSSSGTKINENTKISGTLDVTGKTTLSDALEVNKETTLNDKLTVCKNGIVVSAGGIKVTGDSTFNAAISANSATITTSTKTGTLNVTNNTSVGGTLDVTGTTTAAALKASSITDNGTLTVTGETTLSDKLTIKKNGITVSNGGIQVTGNSAISGTLTASSSKNAYVDNSVIVKSDLLDLIYPVGSIYMIDPLQFKTSPTNSNCPIAEQLGGTWTVVEADFLRCETDSVTTGNLKGGNDAAYLVKHSHNSGDLKCTVKDPVISVAKNEIKEDIFGKDYTYTYTTNNTIDKIDEWKGSISNSETWKKDVLTDVFYLPGGESHRYTISNLVKIEDFSFDGKTGEYMYTISHDGLSEILNGNQAYSVGNHIVIGDGHSSTKPCFPLEYNNSSKTWSEPNIEEAWGDNSWKLQEAQMRPLQYFWPNAVKINMAHVHLAEMSGNVESTGSTDSSSATANRPHYRKVYAWIRTK